MEIIMNENINISDKLLTVTPSPHIKRNSRVNSVMLEVLIALLPASAWGVYAYGWRALMILLISVASCVVFELLTELILKRPITVGDLSAAVTGLLLGMNLPSHTKWWIPIVGSFFAIVVVKQLFGGIGKNFLNPALAGRVFLFLSFSSQMSVYSPSVFDADAVASATVLGQIKGGAAPNVSILDCFFGRTGGGMIGEISALLLLIGGIYLLIRGIIQWHIPVAYIVTCAVFFFLFPSVEGSAVNSMLYELLSGGLMIGALFMATDYVTSPVTRWGRIIFGVGCGLLTFFFRRFTSYPEGVSFAILVMNCFVFYIDRATKPRIFGQKKFASKKH